MLGFVCPASAGHAVDHGALHGVRADDQHARVRWRGLEEHHRLAQSAVVREHREPQRRQPLDPDPLVLHDPLIGRGLDPAGDRLRPELRRDSQELVGQDVGHVEDEVVLLKCGAQLGDEIDGTRLADLGLPVEPDAPAERVERLEPLRRRIEDRGDGDAPAAGPEEPDAVLLVPGRRHASEALRLLESVRVGVSRQTRFAADARHGWDPPASTRRYG